MPKRPTNGSHSEGFHFSPPRVPPNYFSRREQFRLLVLVSMLMLVVALMFEAAKPQNWVWMWGGTDQAATAAAADDEPVDTRLDTQRQPVRPADSFTALPSRPTPAAEDAPASDTESALRVPPDLLDAIKDNTVLRSEESDAWFGLFRILAETDAELIESSSEGQVGFLQLYRQTKEYRGKLVTVEGTVRGVREIPAVDNQLGIERYWQCWLQPVGADSPIVIYTLQLPANFPVKPDVREHAAFTGYCYKRWAYVAGDGTRVAPLLLAKTAKWFPAAKPAPTRLPSASTAVIVLIAVGAIAMCLARIVYATSRRSSPAVSRLGPTSQVRDEAWKQLANAEVAPTVDESLAKLADQQRELIRRFHSNQVGRIANPSVNNRLASFGSIHSPKKSDH